MNKSSLRSSTGTGTASTNSNSILLSLLHSHLAVTSSGKNSEEHLEAKTISTDTKLGPPAKRLKSPRGRSQSQAAPSAPAIGKRMRSSSFAGKEKEPEED